jgi:hypothetical protein
MKTSDTLKEIAVALRDAQVDMKFAVKDSTNPHFKSRYADLGSVIDAVKDSLNLNGIVFIQTPSPSDDGKLHLTTRLLHSSGEWIEDTAVCPLQKNDPQGYGSALTYLRRYSLSAICGLYQDDDDGEATRMNPQDYIKKIQSSNSLQELQKNFASIFPEIKNDSALTKAVVAEKDKMKIMFDDRRMENEVESKNNSN